MAEKKTDKVAEVVENTRDAVNPETSAPVDVEPAEKPVKMVEIELDYAFNTNGEVHGPGKVTVPEGVAEDLVRRNKEYLQYELNLHKRNETLIKAGEVR